MAGIDVARWSSLCKEALLEAEGKPRGSMAQVVGVWASAVAVLLAHFARDGAQQQKVTVVEGHVEDFPGDEPYIRGPSGPVKLVDALPDETRRGCRRWRFRIDVSAEEIAEVPR